MSEILKNGDILRRDYRAILCDPPWLFATRSPKGKGRSAEQHYGCMSLNDIKALPVAAHAAQDAALFLWVPDPHLKLGLEVMEAWGFRYVTVAFTWVKRNKRAEPVFSSDVNIWDDRDFFTGMGYWSRANPEMCLMGTRGHPQRLHKDVRQLIVGRRREHSRKPDEAYERIERLVPGPYLELFARTARPGWDAWGDEVGLFSA